MTSLHRLFTLATLSITTACERQTYTCCIDGYTESCTCPRRQLCAVKYVTTYPDGTCVYGEAVDSGAGGDSGDSGVSATSL